MADKMKKVLIIHENVFYGLERVLRDLLYQVNMT